MNGVSYIRSHVIFVCKTIFLNIQRWIVNKQTYNYNLFRNTLFRNKRRWQQFYYAGILWIGIFILIAIIINVWSCIKIILQEKLKKNTLWLKPNKMATYTWTLGICSPMKQRHRRILMVVKIDWSCKSFFWIS